MSTLPKVPTNLRSSTAEYLTELVRQLERELRARPARQVDGALYLSGDVPLRMISPNGTIYQVVVTDAGALDITEVTL